jgi:NADH dehydrogenase
MGGLTGTRMIEGLLARWFYMSLYKMHQASLYGKFKALKLTISALLYKRIRPKLRLH